MKWNFPTIGTMIGWLAPKPLPKVFIARKYAGESRVYRSNCSKYSPQVEDRKHNFVRRKFRGVAA